ncbi:MAG: hypothetical protein UT05_C0001G0108 [Parcubacteria group bacterium GW2011_GWF2_38_76]|nr:MAG: hypothetical protein UT05_C0001G0108 [Parcubacteria group bacterium GW2011_GWF2_38_76]HBM45916.1 hypothetical protein [Patescibacteria group bacterium]
MNLEKAVAVFLVSVVIVFIALIFFQFFMSEITIATFGGKMVISVLTVGAFLLIIAIREIIVGDENNIPKSK